MLSIIVAISENYAIGKAGDLLCHLPNDLKHFKELTTGATVVMGKKTFFSLPRRPLPNRRNIVLTRDLIFAYEQTEVAHSIEELHITHIHHTWEDADTFFPEIDPTIWQCTSEERFTSDDRHAFAYTFATYVRK